MKACSYRQAAPLTKIVNSLEASSKVVPHRKSGTPIKSHLLARNGICKLSRKESSLAVCTPSDDVLVAARTQVPSPLLESNPTENNQNSVQNDDNMATETSESSEPASPQTQQVAVEVASGTDPKNAGMSDSPLSKLLDSFLKHHDPATNNTINNESSNINNVKKGIIEGDEGAVGDEMELETSLCSADVDVFPLDEEDARFGLSFTDLLGNRSCSSIDLCTPGRKVKFDPQRDIIFEIPSHRIFNDQEKAAIWNNTDAIRLQAYRNYAEWLWEGCSMANVVEEEGFRQDSDGNLLHPAHWTNGANQQLLEPQPVANVEG